jgi:hypothetical protein
MARLVAAGGRLVMAEYVLQPDPHPASEHVRVWNESWEMTLATADQWRRALEDAGWTDVRFLDVTSNMHRSLRRLRRLCRLLSPIAKVLKLVRIRTAAQQRNIRGSVALWDALQAGDWRYCIITATRG